MTCNETADRRPSRACVRTRVKVETMCETTLPIEIFSYLQFQGGQLVIAAASALQIRLILLMIIAVERLVGLARLARS